MLPQGISIEALQLPGRENRITEPLEENYNKLIKSIIAAMDHGRTEPTVFWGHSLGGLIAFEIATQLTAQRYNAPIKLILSGCSPARVTNMLEIIDLPDEDFINTLRDLNGTPDEILQNREALRWFLPMLRADFALAREAHTQISGVIHAPILVLGGTADHGISRANLYDWKRYTTNQVVVHMIEGNHFFINSNRTAVSSIISSYIFAL